MHRSDFSYGFRVTGTSYNPRLLVDANTAMVGHLTLDQKTDPQQECYLSEFRFGADFKDFLKTTKSTKGFTGSCWSPWLWFDIDHPERPQAHDDTKKLVANLLRLFPEFDEEHLLIFFSGNKGFHIGLPLSHNPEPSDDFHQICKRLASKIVDEIPIRIDSSIYDKVRLFRAPNSRHPKSGLYKRALTHKELMQLSTERICELAKSPHEVELPDPPPPSSPKLVEMWQAAIQEPILQEPRSERRPKAEGGTGRLNRNTIEFMQKGADTGERNCRLFAAACDLREWNASPALVHELLNEAALNSGLPPGEIRKAIDQAITTVDDKSKGVQG